MFLRSKKAVGQIKSSKSGAGFTLIELLVVISIIGLLASVVLVSLNSARAKARDARRVGDIKQLTKALELYFDSNNAYPSSSGVLVDDCTDYGVNGVQTVLAGLISAGYLSKIPKDLKGAWPYCYMYMAPGTYDYCDGGTLHPYEIIFTTESTSFSGLPLYTLQGEAGSKARYCIYP